MFEVCRLVSHIDRVAPSLKIHLSKTNIKRLSTRTLYQVFSFVQSFLFRSSSCSGYTLFATVFYCCLCEVIIQILSILGLCAMLSPFHNWSHDFLRLLAILYKVYCQETVASDRTANCESPLSKLKPRRTPFLGLIKINIASSYYCVHKFND